MQRWQDIRPSDGDVLRLAVVGEGVNTSLAPDMISAALKEMDIKAECPWLDVKPEEFDECLAHLEACGFRGVSVGNPHKVNAARAAQRFFVVRHSLGVANALIFENGIFAQNTEVPGFVQTLKDIPPGKALVLGSGGAARSVVLGLLELGWQVHVWNRNVTKSRIFVTLFKRYGDTVKMETRPDPSGCSLVINATPLGVRIGEQPPLLWTYVRPKTVVCDLVYRRVATEFVRNASMKGLRTIDGRELLVEQAALAIEWWTNREVPRAPMRAAVGLR